MKDFKNLLVRLEENKVEFVIVGGFAATLHGTTLLTQDLDICAPFTESNMVRLLSVLKQFNAKHRMIGKTKPLNESAGELSKFKNLYLITDAGYLDILGQIKGLGNYGDLLKHSIGIKLFDSTFSVLDIDGLILAKKQMDRIKDKETVIQLEVIKDKIKDK
ncbi:MAG: hypothetical protein ABIE74_10525 [Pseudomonadota bacterium]